MPQRKGKSQVNKQPLPFNNKHKTMKQQQQKPIGQSGLQKENVFLT